MLRNIILLATAFGAAAAARQYSLGPDSQRKEGVPRGTVEKFTFMSHGNLFPGTQRDYWVYVPAQYQSAKPACLMVFQDGAAYVKEDGDWRVPIVFDNLIQQGSMPVTIGVFVNPGVLPPGVPGVPPLFNRSFEYDSMDDRYDRFLSKELVPEVKKRWNISDNANDHAIGGLSSGGIAAFTAAMLGPDTFSRVLSFIGSYADLRGGDAWPDLVRKMEPAPLRVFLQDGDHDMNIAAGNWWLSNQAMASALAYRGYEVKFVTGTEGHNGKQGGSILPDALRWLWQGWPNPILKPSTTTPGSFPDISKIVDASSEWELVGEGYGFSEGPAVDSSGNVFFVDVPASKIYKVDAATGKVSLFRENTGGASGLMFGRDGRLYAAENGAKRIVAFDPAGKEYVVAQNVGSNDLAVAKSGVVYFTDPSTHHIWRIDTRGNRTAVNDQLQFPNGIRFTDDERMLMVADSATRWVWSFEVQPDGSLANGEPFYKLELPLIGDGKMVNAWADGMAFDSDGYLYIATKSGIQVCDQPGRVFAILRKPSPADPSNVVFGGPDFKMLYVTAKDKVYRRRMLHRGYVPWDPPKWPRPQL
ncbi:MAG: SMP-30/gluconolactonase/LRE family protein [Acidobacteriaceae bacterium]|nr:SMP-30/gluconolactonase/LRE family protein [Acidobacteriaceae bacterium]